MNKKLVKLLAVSLASVSAVSLASCSIGGGGGGGVADDPSTLEIMAWNAGGTTEELNRIVKAFEDANPDIDVDLTASSAVESSKVYLDPDNNTVDLFMSPFETSMAYTKYLEPLDSVLEMEVDGVKISQKLDMGIINTMKSEEGKLYTLPYSSSINGIVYNATVFEEKGYALPQTTNDLVKLTTQIVSDFPGKDDPKPYIYYAEYWKYLTDAWMAQLAGTEVYANWYKGVWTNEDGTTEANSIKIFKENEYKRASYEVLQQLVGGQKNVFTGTNTLTHTFSQTYFMNGKALMTPNGSWLEGEMRNTSSKITPKLMKTPVISALGTKLGLSEAQLKAVISYVDGTATDSQKTYAEGLDEAIVEKVRTARNIYYSEQTQYATFIPEYSTAKDAAKRFIAFYYSDAALLIKEEYGGLLPAVYSDGAKRKLSSEQASAFTKSCLDLDANAIYIGKMLSGKLLYNGGLINLYYSEPARAFTYGNDAKTVKQYFDAENSYWDGAWANILIDADITQE